MKNEDEEKSRIRHIRLPVTEHTGEKGYAFPPSKKKKKKIPKRDYKEGVREIIRSSFSVGRRRINIFKIKLTGKPSPSDLDEIFDWFKATPSVYLSNQEILVKTSSRDFDKVASKLLVRKELKIVRTFVEEVRLLKPEEKMTPELSNIVLQEKDQLGKMNLLIFLVPGFNRKEIQDLQSQISSLISESSLLEMIDSDDGILLSSVSAEDAKNLVEKSYIFQISEDVELQPPEEVKPSRTPPDIIPPGENDPFVCVVDTGADPETLGSALVESSHEDEFADGLDTHGHGTQVSSVVIWGQDMFSEKNQAIGRCRVISHKFNRFGHFSSLYRAVDNAIEKFSPNVRVFNLSANISKHDQHVDRLTMYLDWKIRKKDIVLVNSVGNIPDWAIEKIITKVKYPEYLVGFPVLPPANGNNIVGVGSYALKPSKNLAKKFEVSPYSPLGKSSSTNERSQKPDILVAGGNYELENGLVTRPPDLGVPVFGLNNEFLRNFGTSFAAPFVASLLAQLTAFYPDISHSETLRALLISASELIEKYSGLFFQLKSERNLFYSKDHLTYYTEGSLPARIVHVYATKKLRYTYNRINFLVPEEARTLRIVSVHSDDLPVSKLGFLGSRLKIDVYSPERDEKLGRNNAECWYLNRYTPVNFAVFAAAPGLWNLELTIESTDLPRTLTNELVVRYGLAIRVDLQEELTTPLRSIRESAVQEMGILP
ncbi:MAG: hypothetical protein AYK18_15765 [Theionarchaea archaeon DG-70]|nr:MAG: hypothetical protein AYK18_15765 [Theionarchaea archaeon DG-70]